MRVSIGSLVCLFFCSNVCCGEVSPVDTEVTDNNIKQGLEQLLTAHRLRRADEEFTGDHESRIIGGDPATPGDNPWIVTLYVDGDFYCGGSIIDKRTILTAAHCVVGFTDKAFEIRAGDYSTQKRDEFEQRVQVKKWIIHPRYNKKRNKFDLAILKLDADLEYNVFVKPIAVPAPWKEEFLTNQKHCKLAGHGLSQYYPTPKLPWVLQEVYSTLRNRWFCKKFLIEMGAMAQLPFNPTYQICTQDDEFSGCSGDSGSPLVCYDKNDVPYQVGIVSWGRTDCSNGLIVFGRVSAFKSWIEEHKN